MKYLKTYKKLNENQEKLDDIFDNEDVINIINIAKDEEIRINTSFGETRYPKITMYNGLFHDTGTHISNKEFKEIAFDILNRMISLGIFDDYRVYATIQRPISTSDKKEDIEEYFRNNEYADSIMLSFDQPEVSAFSPKNLDKVHLVPNT